jgi:hypothetical protein
VSGEDASGIQRPSTRVVTVCVLGKSVKRQRHNAPRIRWLAIIAEAIAGRIDWVPVHAVLLPGGFFQLPRIIGPLDHAARVAAIDATRIGAACRRASLLLHDRFVGAILVVGLDTVPVSKSFNGDHVAVAWQGGRIVGIGRKAFPVEEDTNGVAVPPIRCHAADYDSPHRVVALANGRRAILCACYDMFGVRAAGGGSRALLRAIRYLDVGDALGAPPTAARRRDRFDRWCHLLDQSGVDVALAAVHGFDAPGRDGYWQRHGIAEASAALGGGLAIGAAHFRFALPGHADASPLAAAAVPRSHLDDGPTRKSHRLKPIAALILDGAGHDAPAALIRLFEA